jgi:hypothetical protein
MKVIGRIILLVVGLAVIIPWAAWGGNDKNKVIQVKFKPTSIIKKGPLTTPASKIFFEPFRNETASPDQVGENQEDGDSPIRVLSAEVDGPARLIATAFQKEFQEMGFSLADRPEQANRIIGGSIVKFFAVETRLYQTVVRLKVEVKDPDGKVLFNRIYAGSAKRFGRSLSQDNYNETFSDSMIELIETLFSDTEFLKAL